MSLSAKNRFFTITSSNYLSKKKFYRFQKILFLTSSFLTVLMNSLFHIQMCPDDWIFQIKHSYSGSNLYFTAVLKDDCKQKKDYWIHLINRSSLQWKTTLPQIEAIYLINQSSLSWKTTLSQIASVILKRLSSLLWIITLSWIAPIKNMIILLSFEH